MKEKHVRFEVKKITDFQDVIQPLSRKILNLHRKYENMKMEKPRTLIKIKLMFLKMQNFTMGGTFRI